MKKLKHRHLSVLSSSKDFAVYRRTIGEITVGGFTTLDACFYEGWITSYSDGVPIAITIRGAVRLEWQSPCANLFVYVLPDYRGQGLMKEIVSTLVPGKVQARYVYGASIPESTRSTILGVIKFDVYSIWSMAGGSGTTFCIDTFPELDE